MKQNIILPSGEVVGAYELILPDGHFAWYEATKNMTRIPASLRVERGVYEAAKMMEWVRYELGSYPLYVTSWIRDYATNMRVGGSKSSRHLLGQAVDFRCNHLTPKQIFNKLNPLWEKGGLGLYKSHVHIDCRGHKARW